MNSRFAILILSSSLLGGCEEKLSPDEKVFFGGVLEKIQACRVSICEHPYWDNENCHSAVKMMSEDYYKNWPDGRYNRSNLHNATYNHMNYQLQSIYTESLEFTFGYSEFTRAMCGRVLRHPSAYPADASKNSGLQGESHADGNATSDSS